MKSPEDVHGSAGPRLQWCCRVPARSKELYVPRDTLTATKFQVNRVDTVRVDNHEFLVALLE